MSMNCLEFRRAIAVQPRQLDAAARAHRDGCPRCAEAYAKAMSFESLLDRSLAVEVPATLADQILLRQTTLDRQHNSGRRALVWRMAAGVALAVGVVGMSWLALGPQQTLAAMSVAHLSHEPMALTTQGTLPGVEVSRTFEQLGVHLRHTPVPISYLQICPLGLRRALHMVVQSPQGAVTVMYVPDAETTRRDFSERGVLGRELQVGKGVLVMLASSRDAFDGIEQGFRAAL
jgi:hypothetical protein